MNGRTIAGLTLGVVFGLLLFPSALFAATLSVDPTEGTYGPGDMFMVTVRLDTATDECVNVAMVELHYPNDWIKATVVSKGESLLSLWTDEPTIDHERGIVSFSGGIPAGYCGRVQGDPGKTNILARVVFNVPGNMIGGKVATGPVPMEVSFGSSTALYLNDGFGTPATLRLEGATFERALVSTQLKNEWLDVVHADDVPPDQFIATIEHDPNMFEGRYFLAFTTVDKQSGINHFEVKEDDPERLDFVRGKNDHAEFVTSPSLYYFELKDQELKSRITVRAVDNARNHTDQILPPLRGEYARSPGTPDTAREKSPLLWLVYGSIPLLLLLSAGYFFFLRRKQDAGVADTTTSTEEQPYDEHPHTPA